MNKQNSTISDKISDLRNKTHIKEGSSSLSVFNNEIFKNPDCPTVAEYLQYVDKEKVTDIYFTEDNPVITRSGGGEITREKFRIPMESVIDFVSNCKSTTQDIYKLIVSGRPCNLSIETNSEQRIRVKVSYSMGKIQIFFRVLPTYPPDLNSLGYEHIITDLRRVDMESGLFVVSGETGSGKSTFMASWLEARLKEKRIHVVTVEDPVEYIIRPYQGFVSQREVGLDVPDFAEGVRSSLREDPDIIMVGEIRDVFTATAALTAAETGHFVICTIHAGTHAGVIDRLFGLLGENEASMRLSNIYAGGLGLKRIFSDKNRFTNEANLMLGTTAVKTAIREGKTQQIESNWDMSRRSLQNEETTLKMKNKPKSFF